jgi:uncharacterized protein
VEYYLDTCAILKFVKPEKESSALRAWRESLPTDAFLVTSELSRLEISRSLHRGGVDRTQVPYYRDLAMREIWISFVSRPSFNRALTYDKPRLGSLDALHLAAADGLGDSLAALVTYDGQLAAAAQELGMETLSPT